MRDRASPGSGPGHVWVNGQLQSADALHLSAYDRGFQLGDAVFETIRAVEGRVLELGEHLARLRHSADGMGLALGDEMEGPLVGGIRELLAADGLDDQGVTASVRITVSRGTTPDRSLLPQAAMVPTIVLQASRVAAPSGGLPRGIGLIASSVRHDPHDPMATIKTTSRASFVFARAEAIRAGADDAVLLTTDGHLAEATQASLFFVRGNELCTPSLECGILDGTTRTWILRWAGRVGLRPAEGWFTPEDLAAAHEAFICASVAGVVPVTRFNGNAIGGGEPGPWTVRAREGREAFARGKG